MSMTEKAAYLKGLAEGMELGDSKNEKLIKAIIDVIDEMAGLVDDIDEDLDVFADQLDAVDEDLADLEECVYEDGCCCDDDDCCCDEVITVDGDILDEGSVQCPACGEKLEFDLEFDDEDAEDE